jgi:Carbohydrate binding domain
MTPLPTHHHANPARRRGTAYVFVLLTAMILGVIGLAALMTARVQTQVQSDNEDVLRVRFLAQSLAECALQRIDADANWRTTYTNDTWTPPTVLNGATYSFKLVDEADGNLANDASQPARLYAKASLGGAMRTYSVVITPPTHVNQIVNGGAESGLLGWTAYPAGSATIAQANNNGGPRSGAYFLAVTSRSGPGTGVEQDVKSQLNNGANYRVAFWLRVKSATDTARISINVDATGGATETAFTATGQSSWTKVTGQLTPTWTGTLNTAVFRVTTLTTNKDFHLDDVDLFIGSRPPPAMVSVPGTWRQEVGAP